MAERPEQLRYCTGKIDLVSRMYTCKFYSTLHVPGLSIVLQSEAVFGPLSIMAAHQLLYFPPPAISEGPRKTPPHSRFEMTCSRLYVVPATAPDYIRGRG